MSWPEPVQRVAAVLEQATADRIPLGQDGTLRVIVVRPGGDPDDDLVLVVERV